MVINQLRGRLALGIKLNIDIFIFLTGIKRFGDKDMFQHDSLPLLSVSFRGDIQFERLVILPLIVRYVSFIFFPMQTEMQNVFKQ